MRRGWKIRQITRRFTRSAGRRQQPSPASNDSFMNRSKTITVRRHTSEQIKPGAVLRFTDGAQMIVREDGALQRVVMSSDGKAYARRKVNKKERRKLRAAAKV